jgi:hypothetical protein
LVIALVMANAASLPPERAAAAVTVPMPITANCTDDVTGAFDSRLRSGPDSPAVVFCAGGCDRPQLAAEQSRSLGQRIGRARNRSVRQLDGT